MFQLTRVSIRIALVLMTAMSAAAQSNRVDVVTPLAPELASYGQYAVGVRTIQATDKNRPDILNTKEGGPTARYDRTLTLEVWYPASLNPGQSRGGDYPGVVTRDPKVIVTLHGQAVRDAAPLKTGAPFPLIIVSHGYPGDRYLMTHLTENLASKGYVVVAIEHKDSLYDDMKPFASTLYNRPFDQLFTLKEMARLGETTSSSFLAGLVDADHTGIVGYSMGGYGLVNVLGGAFSKAIESQPGAPPNHLLADRGASNPEYRKSIDPRIKAAIAIAPWGLPAGVWDAEGLAGIKTPIMFVAGSADDVSGYEKGTRAIYEGSVNADRYLLTFVGANHNAAAPIPAPDETYVEKDGQTGGFNHYADTVWDTVRMNNILDHFATVYFGVLIKGEKDKQTYLDVLSSGKDAVFALDKDGKATPQHTYWKGFKRKTVSGLMLEHLAAAKP